MRRLKSLIAILLLLWLPLQAAAAWTMPFTLAGLSVNNVVAPAGTPVPPPCHGEAVAPDETAMQQIDLQCDSHSCNECAVCHLTSAGFLPVAATWSLPRVANVLVAPLSPLPFSFIGDPPQQPPRSRG